MANTRTINGFPQIGTQMVQLDGSSGHRLLDESAMATARGLPYGRCFAADSHFRGDPEHHAPWKTYMKHIGKNWMHLSNIVHPVQTNFRNEIDSTIDQRKNILAT